MIRKYALKRLTASDLTLFEWHFRNRNAGNQKAINLNADVFVDALYPSAEVMAKTSEYKLPLDLWIVGPGTHPAINLQRKIIKGAAYKNWRLDGEFIVNPPDESERFNVLNPGDFVLLGFEGDLFPVSATAVFVAKDDPADEKLFHILSKIIGESRMVALSDEDVSKIPEAADLPDGHPIRGFVIDEDMIEATSGNAVATERTLKKRRIGRLAATDLKQAREMAEATGQLGEALVDVYLQQQLEEGLIAKYEWISATNAIAPLDFRIQNDESQEKLDVKTTTGKFEREFHVSTSELLEMTSGDEPYRIYRLYEASKDGAKLRISDDFSPIAEKILTVFKGLPFGVTPDGVSIKPDANMFSHEIVLNPVTDDDT